MVYVCKHDAMSYLCYIAFEVPIRAFLQVFVELAKKDGEAILQRDNEDAEKLAKFVQTGPCPHFATC